MAYEISQQGTVTRLRFRDVALGWEQWFYLRSDVHHDNLNCDRALEDAHLKEARRLGAGILDFGDLFCCMQGRWDKRADQNQLRPELRGSNYLDRLVECAAERYGPYADLWVLMARGNHESAVQQRHETDLTRRLTQELRQAGSPVVDATYAGWVRFEFEVQTTKRRSINLRYTHGYGGGGPVTKDVIQTNRQLAYIEDAEIIVSGHTHDAWHIQQEREGLDHYGIPVRRTVDMIKCGGYQDSYQSGQGWAVERGQPPKPLGGWFLRFYYHNAHIEREFRRTFTMGRREL